MKQQSTKYFILILLIAVLVIPSVALASWWNPLSWGIWNNIFHQPLTTQSPVACPMYCLQNMLCGSDGKNYCNECLAKGAGATIVHEGKCAMPIVGGDKDNHGCIGSAGYSWCATKNKCLRVWEESCEIAGDVYPLFSSLKWSASSAQRIQDISGYQITATDTINSNTDARKFFSYYDSKLKSQGWTTDNSFAADGILGSQVGYEKSGSYIILGYTIKPGKITSGANEPLQWTCPCSVTYTVFTGSGANQTTCITEGGTYGANFHNEEPCCKGLIKKAGSQSGTWGSCVKSADQPAGCLNSGGTVSTQTCYCSGTQDFYNNCAIGACTCTPNPAYARQIKTCSCGEGKCFDGNKCVNISY